MFNEKFRAPIIQYTEIIPQTLWQKITKQNPKQRLRIKRAMPQHFNCRCSITIIK